MNNKRRFLIQESLKRKVLSKWFLGINIILFLLISISFNMDYIITFFDGTNGGTKNCINYWNKKKSRHCLLFFYTIFTCGFFY